MAIAEPNKKNNKWVWIGLGGALVFCLCTVTLAGLLFTNIKKQFEQGMKTDPQSAAEAAHKIVDYELPPGYQEETAMDFLIYSIVIIDDTSTSSTSKKPMIMLAQFEAGVTQEQMEQQLQQSIEQQSGQRGYKMNVVETRTMTIRGEETEVVVYEGTNDKGVMLRQLGTSFPGKNGTVMLMITGSPQYWDQEEIDAFLESIH
jgi:hypothetical protein